MWKYEKLTVKNVLGILLSIFGAHGSYYKDEAKEK